MNTCIRIKRRVEQSYPRAVLEVTKYKGSNLNGYLSYMLSFQGFQTHILHYMKSTTNSLRFQALVGREALH